ncbi:MAG TPA: class F sortase [Chloroflexota bacterium]|nr:class F sortase [Chloroflexota bacterium]
MTLIGALILIGSVGYFGYGQYEQAALANQAAATAPSATTTATLPRRGERSGGSAHASAAGATVTAVPPHDGVPSSAPAPTAVDRSAAPVLRITASSIGLDAKVAESPIVDGQWIIPKFEAGHLQGTAQPGTGGNVVLAGHVQSITSGDVFANLDQLRPGDTITAYTHAATVTYVVQQVGQVSNDDVSVLKPGPHETLTLITCSGTWLPLQHDYSERTVVVAVRR